MRKYLVDTTVFIDHLRNQPQAGKILAKQGLVVSAVTIGELFQGCRNKKEQNIIEELVKQFEISWGSAQINQLAVKLLKNYYLSFNLNFFDALIAATALMNNLILITDNVKHFKFIKNLKVAWPKKLL